MLRYLRFKLVHIVKSSSSCHPSLSLSLCGITSRCCGATEIHRKMITYGTATRQIGRVFPFSLVFFIFISVSAVPSLPRPFQLQLRQFQLPLRPFQFQLPLRPSQLPASSVSRAPWGPLSPSFVAVLIFYAFTPSEAAVRAPKYASLDRHLVTTSFPPRAKKLIN